MSWLKEVAMKSPRIKSFKKSRDVLCVPFYLRHFNLCEKIIIALSIFISSMTVSSIPLVVIAFSSTSSPETTTTEINSSEAELLDLIGERK